MEELRSEIPLTVIRPGIVCGPTKTGENAGFDVSTAQECLKNINISCSAAIEIMPILVEFYKKNKNHKELLIPIK